MRNSKGQTTLELAFLLPILIMLTGGMLFMVYAGWQDLKVQQAANLVARVEGQEKVSGGRSIDAINKENGFGPGVDRIDANENVGRTNFEISNNTQASSGGAPKLFDRLKILVAGLFTASERNSVSVLTPRSGQNVDQVTVTRTFTMPKIPFMKGSFALPDQITLKGVAYGGEDPYMYALPRWGKTSDSGIVPEWRNLLKDAAARTKSE